MSTDAAWEQWGAVDPYYGVITDPRFRSAALTPEAKEVFFASGLHHVADVRALLDRYGGGFAPESILDFGCGVGRLVIPFAAGGARVVGVDVSASMLAEARRNCDERGASTVELVVADDELSGVPDRFHLVHSAIVLQHIDIARGRLLFAKLVDRIAPRGWGIIHVTYGWDLHARYYGQLPPPTPEPPIPWWRALLQALSRPFIPPRSPEPVPAPSPDPEMRMNFYNLSELFFILHQAGIATVHSDFTNHGGALGATLTFQKPA